MSFLYNIVISVTYFIIKIAAIFDKKLNLFVDGRNETFKKLSFIKQDDSVIWLHAASLGEFEQGRPIIERLKILYPNYKIIVTFFSPSGYEVRKNYDLADVVCYLPFDTKSNVKRFIKQIHPDLAIIIKYEFWPNLLTELARTETKTILVSGIFRKKQSFFKIYGKWMQKKLKAFNHFFIQNQESKDLLKLINFNNATVSGDTRFDRVYEILQQNNSLNFIDQFKNNTYTVVAGSTWKEDEELLINYINKEASFEEKFIIAPHNINTNQIDELKKLIDKKVILYSEKEGKDLSKYQVFIVDTIGILTKIYSVADIAYVGGGLSTGLHNILEPATYGIPIVFGGNNYKNFKEATDLEKLKGAKSIKDQEEFSSIFAQLKTDFNLRSKMGNINKNYVKNNIGATDLIIDYIKKKL